MKKLNIYFTALFIITAVFFKAQNINAQTYLIRELKGGIWVTSQVEITNAVQTNQTNNTAAAPNIPKNPIKINSNVITSEEIERRGYKNAQEVLANQPGFVNKGSYMGNETVEPAGGSADNMKIYVNGVLMNTSKGNADAGVDLRRIPSNLIEKIEIIGNSIYITTKTPIEDILLISFGYGAYNTITPSILFSKNFDNKHIVTFTADSYYTDGDYYYVDTTWGDPVFQAEEGGEASILGHISYDYMCCSEEQLLKTHTPDATAALPECTKMDANYYVVNGMYYETYDPSQILESMNQVISEKGNPVVVKFAEEQVYEEARNDILERVVKFS